MRVTGGRTPRRVLWALAALAVSLLAGATTGSSVPGFSSGGWNGYVNYDTSRLRFGIVDAHEGLLGTDHCSASTALNDDFAGGAGRLEANGHVRHAFWFLTSLYHGQSTCGWTESAYAWGAEQAEMFVEAIQLSGYDGWIDLLFADVEYTGIDCASDLARWRCNGATNNRAVIKGFSDYLTYLEPETNGVYSGGYQWREITDDAEASDVGTSNFWLAYWGATLGELEWTVGALQNWGYTVVSWQYTVDEGPYCLMTYATAENRAYQAIQHGYYVLRFDQWDNDQVIQIIDQVPGDCDY